MKIFNLRFQKQGGSKILLFGLSMATTLALCEIALEVVNYSVHKKGYFFFPPHLKTVFKPSSEIMPGISGDSEFRINSDGIRGDEITPQHSYRILAVGGSTTMCGYLDQSETWAQLLQESLNRNIGTGQVWVGNGGVSGLATNHHVVALRNLPLRELKIDTVILLPGVNDLSLRLSRDKNYNPKLLEQPEAEKELLAQTFTGTFDSYSDDPFFKRIAIWQLLRRTKKLLLGAHIEDERGSVYVTWREHRKHASEIRDQLPDLSSALDEYSRNIKSIIDITHEKSVRLIFMTQPTMWKSGLSQNLDSLLWLGGIGDFQKESDKPYYSAAALEKGMKAYNDTLVRVCQERQIECIDLASIMEKDTTVFYDDVHFNESGARKIAATLSRYLLEQDPFRKSQIAP